MNVQGSLPCDFCQNNYETKRCSGCRVALYCSKTCQKNHWSKHKANCIRADSSIHELEKVCGMDVVPEPGSTVARDYGFDNVRDNHGDVLWGDSTLCFEPMTAETLLLGVFQLIINDVGNLELGDIVYNSIGASKKMIVEAYEKNELDDFFHRFIRNVLSRHGQKSHRYFFAWIWNRLVIGPTRTEGLTRQQIQKMRQQIYYKYYGSLNPAKCSCLTLKQPPTVDRPMGF